MESKRSKFNNMLIQRRMVKEANMRPVTNSTRPKRVNRVKCRVTKGKFHVYVRGFQKRELFHDDDERIMFLIIVNEVVVETKSTLYAYILMDNHFHFLLYSNDLPALMGQILYRYSRWYKRRWPIVMKVFDTPYGSCPITRPSTFYDTFLYLLSNAKRARMCEHHQDYFWSSANQYFAAGRHLLDSYIKVDTTYVQENFKTERALDKLVNEYTPRPGDGKPPIRKFSSDAQVANHFHFLVNGRSVNTLEKRELDYIIKSLRFNCHATYPQIMCHIPRSLNYIRNICKFT